MSDPVNGSWYLYRISPNRLEMLLSGPTPEEAHVLQEHSAYLKDLTDRGVLLLAGRTLNNDETTFGIAIIKAANPAEARALMNNDPFVKRGVARAVLFPFTPAFIGQI